MKTFFRYLRAVAILALLALSAFFSFITVILAEAAKWLDEGGDNELEGDWP